MSDSGINNAAGPSVANNLSEQVVRTAKAERQSVVASGNNSPQGQPAIDLQEQLKRSSEIIPDLVAHLNLELDLQFQVEE